MNGNQKDMTHLYISLGSFTRATPCHFVDPTDDNPGSAFPSGVGQLDRARDCGACQALSQAVPWRIRRYLLGTKLFWLNMTRFPLTSKMWLQLAAVILTPPPYPSTKVLVTLIFQYHLGQSHLGREKAGKPATNTHTYKCLALSGLGHCQRAASPCISNQ